ncbi:hypothetical protein [Thermoplasma acidophilum]|uniref:Uncharacterized protein n=1 Tax=Thermoplasma acidophilum (strain ATCC 25905 / DSM 1728 / JCM 9062 / NBRC 15155 / AMRC-C165) TaxID=273075 RepID=Q9HJ23_THEAC|nr:hypothetical protein [Thermoplasma acidophilum]
MPRLSIIISPPNFSLLRDRRSLRPSTTMGVSIFLRRYFSMSSRNLFLADVTDHLPFLFKDCDHC